MKAPMLHRRSLDGGAPAITSIAPDLGDSLGGATIEVVGVNLSDVDGVLFGATPGTIVSVSPNKVVVRAPALTKSASAGLYGVQLTTPTSASNVLVDAYESWNPAESHDPGNGRHVRVFQSDQGVLSSGSALRTRTGIVLADADSPVESRDGAGMLRLASGRILLLGGWHPGNWPSLAGGAWDDVTNEVWYSDDNGRSWSVLLEHDEAPTPSGAGARFKPGHTTGCFLKTIEGVEYVYWIGGDAVADWANGEVWRSADGGSTWTRISTDAPTGARVDRANLNTVDGLVLTMMAVYDGDIYIMGGQSNLYNENSATSEVWKSTDHGVTWTQLADAPWSPRGGVFSPVEYDGHLWVVGGAAYATLTDDRIMFNDVWKFDGEDWTEVAVEDDTIDDTNEVAKGRFTPRHYTSLFVYESKLWLLMGYDKYQRDGNDGDLRDAWYSTDGATWTRADRVEFTHHTHAQSAAVLDEGVLCTLGIQDKSFNMLEQVDGELVYQWNDVSAGSTLSLRQPTTARKPVKQDGAFGAQPGIACLGAEFMRVYDSAVPGYVSDAAIGNGAPDDAFEAWVCGKTWNRETARTFSANAPCTLIGNSDVNTAFNGFGLDGGAIDYREGSVAWTVGSTSDGDGLFDNRPRMLGVQHADDVVKLFVGATQQGATHHGGSVEDVYTGWDTLGAGVEDAGEPAEKARFIFGFAVVVKGQSLSDATFIAKMNKWSKKWGTVG